MRQALAVTKLGRTQFAVSALIFFVIFLVIFAIQQIPAVQEGMSIGSGESGSIRYAAGAENSPAWNATVFTFAFMSVGIFAYGIVTTAHSRTYLGAGMTRKNIIYVIALNGLIAVVATALIAALLWAITAFLGMPELEGMSTGPILIELGSLVVGYLAGAFMCALFIRFTWWKVALGFLVLIAIAVALGLTWAWVSTGGAILTLDSSEADAWANVLNILTVPVMAIGVWYMIRTLPIRRS